jgi:hypothetical protein
MSHAAMPAPASTPNAKTAMPVTTRAGVSDAKVVCVGRRCSAMGTRQRSPAPAQCDASFVPTASCYGAASATAAGVVTKVASAVAPTEPAFHLPTTARGLDAASAHSGRNPLTAAGWVSSGKNAVRCQAPCTARSTKR